MTALRERLAEDSTEPFQVHQVRGMVVVALALTGFVSARLGDADPRRAILRNVVGGSLGMAVTYTVGLLFHVAA